MCKKREGGIELKKVKTLILLFVIIMSSFAMGCMRKTVDKCTIINSIEEKIGIHIPNEAELLEYYNTRIFVHGRLPVYCIFEFDKEPTDFLASNYFDGKENADVEQAILEKLSVENDTYDLRISNDSFFVFDKDYLMIYEEYNYCLVYYSDSQRLYVFIEAT